MSNLCFNRITLTANTPEQKSELNKVLGYLDNTSDGKDGLFNQIIPVSYESDRTWKWGTQSDVFINDAETDVELNGIKKVDNQYHFEGGEVSVKLWFDTESSSCFRVLEELHNRGLDVYAEFEEETRYFWWTWKNGVRKDILWNEATIEDITYFEIKDNKLTADLFVDFVGDKGLIEQERVISLSGVEIEKDESLGDSGIELSEFAFLKDSILNVVESAINNEAKELGIELTWEDNYYYRLQDELESAYNRS